MKIKPTNPARRRFLSGVGGAGGALALGGGASLLPVTARAQNSQYRALVCVFLYGGNDGLNMVPPTDSAAYARYNSVRQSLALPSSNIIDLDGAVGLHGALHPLRPLWDAGSLAVINNVGVLSRPTSQEDYFAWQGSSDNTLIPDNLFSHSDQQILWESGHADAMTRTGWGGRLLESLGNASPVYGFGKPSRFGEGEFSQQLSLPPSGSQLGLQGFSSNNRWADARLSALQQLVAQDNGNVLQSGFSYAQFSAFETSALLGDILEQSPSAGAADPANPMLSEAFEHFAGGADNSLNRQLYQVAKMIRHRSEIGGDGHIYFVSLDGFDHHGDQIARHDELLTQVGRSLASFQQAMTVMSVSDQVTLFTESDFGRTFKPNNSGGTDHGWGNQQLVLGGAVNGGRTHGVYPSLELGGPDDSGEKAWEQQGRWIPGISVDQYLATLTDWFAPGLGADIAQVLPNLQRFDQRNVGFMQ